MGYKVARKRDATMERNAYLILENGMLLEGVSIGAIGHTTGELIFNTAHVGYQETLTDPSYAGQLIVFTSPHIGNTGCNDADEESPRCWASGLIAREQPTAPSYWRSQLKLQHYLKKHELIGIAEIDTRYLTRLLVQHGHLRATIVSDQVDRETAKNLALNYQMHSEQLLQKVTTHGKPHFVDKTKFRIVVYDFGIKNNILSILEKFDCEIMKVPASSTLQTVLDLHPDGILLSNGPGDPREYVNIIEEIRLLIKKDIPLFGICLGHQLLGLAFGAKIEKLKFGHHGINHPIKETRTNRVFITSQNHNFALSKTDFPEELSITYYSLFDHSIQGFQHMYKPIFGLQGHPEGGPGPVELSAIFKDFFKNVELYHRHKDVMQKAKMKVIG